VACKDSPSCFTPDISQSLISRRFVREDTKHARAASGEQRSVRARVKQRRFRTPDFRFYLKDHAFKVIVQRPLAAITRKWLREGT
jgi:hypothetical protein